MPEKRKRKFSQSTKLIPSSDSSNGSTQAVPWGSGGDNQAKSMVNLDAFLSEISSRLVTAGNIALPQQTAQIVPQERMQVIIFTLGTVHYAIEASNVEEVVRSPEFTRVPGLPEWVLGVTNLHGDIVSAVDLPLFLNISDHVISQAAYMIVAKAGDQHIGLVVDGIDIIYTFPAEQVISPPFKIAPELVPYMRGAIERQDEFVRFLDCGSLLLGSQMQQFS